MIIYKKKEEKKSVSSILQLAPLAQRHTGEDNAQKNRNERKKIERSSHDKTTHGDDSNDKKKTARTISSFFF